MIHYTGDSCLRCGHDGSDDGRPPRSRIRVAYREGEWVIEGE